jgi:hypothetical protein
MDGKVPKSNDVLPGNFAVLLAELIWQTAGGFAYHDQLLQDCGLTHLILDKSFERDIRNKPINCIRCFKDIRKIDFSCRIQFLCFSQNAVANDRLQSILRHQVDRAVEDCRELSLHLPKCEKSHHYTRVEGDQYVYVAIWPRLATHHGTEKRQATYLVSLAELIDLFT